MKRKIFLTFICVLFISLMVILSQTLGEPEIIFPEVAALTIGAWLAPVPVWKTTRLKMSLLITANAFLGVVFVRYIDAPVFIKTGALILICYAQLDLFKTSFAPMICAAVLPVYLGTRSWIYPVSAACFVVTVCFIQFIMEKTGFKSPYQGHTDSGISIRQFSRRIKQWAVLMVIAFVPIAADDLFFIAPPLLVGFTELSDPAGGARKHPVKLVVLTACCAGAGVLCRYIFTITLGLPLAVSAFAAACTVAIVMQYTHLFFPPAGAITILSMLIPQQQLIFYPFKVCAGFTALTLAAIFLFRSNVKELSVSQKKSA
ncbi:MAG: HPP family protein [Oscillospiraceae bacterium]|nr:HPP family protein [Oscillospiraceae bacterium]